jgi:hypothetical protein
MKGTTRDADRAMDQIIVFYLPASGDNLFVSIYTYSEFLLGGAVDALQGKSPLYCRDEKAMSDLSVRVYLWNDNEYNHFYSVNKCEVIMYIDPNTGGVLFQALTAAFAVVSVVLLTFSGRIRHFIARMRRRIRKDQSEDQE